MGGRTVVGSKARLRPPVVEPSAAPASPPGGAVADLFEIDGVHFVAFQWDARGPAPNVTAAESAVLEILLQGGSNAQIALARSTSVRTVANQVASLLRKLGVGSRYELLARYGGGPT